MKVHFITPDIDLDDEEAADLVEYLGGAYEAYMLEGLGCAGPADDLDGGANACNGQTPPVDKPTLIADLFLDGVLKLLDEGAIKRAADVYATIMHASR